MELKERIKELRKKKGVTQKELGEALGITSVAEQRYEYGDRKPNLKMLIALADYFNVSIDYLAGRSSSLEINRGNEMKQLGQNLKELRIEKKKKQDELAEYLRVTTRQYQRYESGEQEPNLDKLIKIADYYGVSTDYLLGRTDNPKFDK